MKLTLYGLLKCSTCKKAMQWLDEHRCEYAFIDYRAEPIDPTLLVAWARSLGWTKLVNRASMTWRNLPATHKDPQGDDAWLALIAAYPALVKRPVVVLGNTVHAGFSAARFEQQMGTH